jgi:hypothetical protein
MEQKPVRLDIKPSLDLRKAIDRWRIEEPSAPSRAKAARMLIEIGLKSERQRHLRNPRARIEP